MAEQYRASGFHPQTPDRHEPEAERLFSAIQSLDDRITNLQGELARRPR